MRKRREMSTVALPNAILPELDRLAREHGMSRSAYVLLLVRVNAQTGTLAELERRVGRLEGYAS